MTSRFALFALFGSALFSTACQSAPATISKDPAVAPSSAAAIPPAAAKAAEAEKTAFGDPLSQTAAKVTLAELMKSPSTFADKTVQTEGTVTSVCQARGCWLELGDASGTAHVKLGSHKFFVPRSSNGKHARVEATVLPAVDQGHCEEEAEEQTGKTAKVELVATGVELF